MPLNLPAHLMPETGPIVDPARLAALDDLELLDTGPEEALDRITRLAARCLGVPISLLSLLEHDRQFFKSSVGTPSGMSEIPLTGSLCRYTVEAGEPLIVDDARSHPVVRGISSIEEYGVVAYAGAPLVTGGQTVGTLCAIDSAPRTWTEREVAILVDLAAIAVSEIELRAMRARERRGREALERRVAEGATRLQVVSDALGESHARLEAAHEEGVRRMARAVQVRSEETGVHIARMSALCGFIARRLGFGPVASARLELASTLHDIGKIAVPDSILKKPGPLSPEERAIVERHVKVGHDMLGDSNDPTLELAATIALTHHERLDGSGYPNGLVGEQIPIEGRIAAAADVFDALTSDRVYRRALSAREAFETMQRVRGTQFDPQVLDALAAHPEVASAGSRDTARPVSLPQ